VLLCGTH